MTRSRNHLQGHPPKCAECGSLASVHVALIEPGDPGKGHTWLCGSCEYLRENPDAKRGEAPGLPINMRPKRKQKETLF